MTINEIRLLASVNHSNVIHYKEAYIDRSKVCIVMELAANGDLAQIIRRSSAARCMLHEEDVWSFFIQVTRGLQVSNHPSVSTMILLRL